MEQITGWLRSILYVDILILIGTSLLENTRYENYVRFFSGFLLVLCMLQPLMKLTSAESLLDFSYLRTLFQNEKNVLQWSEELSSVREEAQEDYQTAVEGQIRALGRQSGLDIKEIEITWKDKGEQVESITMEIQKKEQGTKIIREYRQALADACQLELEHVIISEEGNHESE